eukprot:CAMPEP_0204650170 /NCGR_PEP_ID=MMETSP0718-20130828/11023_1 /ASSEMBLY_ACC=CAM_ASM_000674 /TAXON_ID=230516 /ORGANISM="Chaetoceros curvisetus" /LENGTH=282 /DNA_ID=CAMNT_0051673471 /DNA_START=26 /DNA_END=874 /DNA_ORIENTATION=+
MTRTRARQEKIFKRFMVTQSTLSSFQFLNQSPKSIQPLRTMKQTQMQIVSQTKNVLQFLWKVLLASFRGASLAIKESWWCLPMLVIAIPIYSAVFHGTYAKMPNWWAFEGLGYLKDMPGLCVTFLVSNIFYFLSGLYLLDCINIEKLTKKQQWSSHTSRYPLLGALTLTSGIISVIYHTCQALGNINVAETLCFVDHGVALTSGLYFFRKCGVPSIKTLAIGVPSLAFLAFPGDMYPVIHSLWHMGSSGVTISWALDGVDKRKKYISSTLRQRKSKGVCEIQ